MGNNCIAECYYQSGPGSGCNAKIPDFGGWTNEYGSMVLEIQQIKRLICTSCDHFAGCHR